MQEYQIIRRFLELQRVAEAIGWDLIATPNNFHMYKSGVDDMTALRNTYLFINLDEVGGFMKGLNTKRSRTRRKK